MRFRIKTFLEGHVYVVQVMDDDGKLINQDAKTLAEIRAAYEADARELDDAAVVREWGRSYGRSLAANYCGDHKLPLPGDDEITYDE